MQILHLAFCTLIGDLLLVSGLVSRSTKSLIEAVQEEPKSNVPLVELHAKLVTVLWIIMGLDMKSVKPLTLFDTTVNIMFLSLFIINIFLYNIRLVDTEVTRYLSFSSRLGFISASKTVFT